MCVCVCLRVRKCACVCMCVCVKNMELVLAEIFSEKCEYVLKVYVCVCV